MIRGRLLTPAGDVLVDPCLRTTNPWDRMRGLLLRPPPDTGCGLLIDPCKSVHTFAMNYPIDVVYLDRNYRIARCIEALAPWRVAACKKANMTLELRAGEARRLGLTPELELAWRAD